MTHCIVDPISLLIALENSLSVLTDYPGTEFAKTIGYIAMFTENHWRMKCGEHDFEVYC